MRKVNRNSLEAPSSLSGDNSVGGRELVKARAHFTAVPLPDKEFTFRAYKEDDVRQSLEKLFHGKCAYCESRYDIVGPVDIEHFRPKKGVEGEDAHLGYWWLAATWTNLLPSCLDCNRRRYQPTPVALASMSAILDAGRRAGFDSIKTGKETCFPVTGARVTNEPAASAMAAALAAEQAILLDPCNDGDEPGAHINFYIDRDQPLGVVFAAAANDPTAPGEMPMLSPDVTTIENAARASGISVRGAVSIQVYGLNRLGLVQERTRILRHLEFLGDTIINLTLAADELGSVKVRSKSGKAKLAHALARINAQVARTLAELRDMAAPEAPFSCMVTTWLKSFEADLADPARADPI